MVQQVDDDINNCLHFSCKYGLSDMVANIVDMCTELSRFYSEKRESEFIKQFVRSGYKEKAKHKSILMGLMQTINSMDYPPFFYLCDRYENGQKGYFDSIVKLVEQVKKEKYTHEFDYLFIHESSGYSALHWLAYHDDHEAIKWILEH